MRRTSRSARAAVIGVLNDLPAASDVQTRSTGRRSWTAALAYAAAAVVFTWPLALHLRSLFGAADATGDPSLNLWTLGWDLRVLTTHPAWFITGRVFDANIFHPARLTLAYSDHLLLQALAVWPLYAVSHDVVFCYNVLLLVSLIASAFSMHLLARTIAGRETPAYVGGLVFGFAPYHFTHLTHLQLQALYFLPLSFVCLIRMFERRRARDGAWLGLVLALQAVSSAYYGVIGALGILWAAIVMAIAARLVPSRRLLGCAATALVTAAIVAAPWSIPYVRVKRDVGAGRTLFEAAQASAVPASYLQAPPTNLVYGRSNLLTPGQGARLARKDGPEQALFPGFVAMILAVLGLVTAFSRRELIAAPTDGATSRIRSPRTIALTFLAVGIAGFVLSLGPAGIRPLYSALYNGMAGMEAIRAAARFSVLVLCAISVLAVLGASRVGRKAGPAAVVLVALCAGIEFLNGSIPYPMRPALTTNAGRWLAAQPGTGAVICLPMRFDRENTPCMLQSLEHGRPIVNGYSGLRPPFFSAVVDAMSRMPSPEGITTLHDLNVQYIVADAPLQVPPTLQPFVAERAGFDDQTVYELTWSDAAAALLTFDSGPPPPPPGPPRFKVNESATYRVHWTSGPMNVPAGEMTIGVAPPSGGESYRFVGSAKTAPWVARFFEATATMETTAGPQLFPIVHAETIDDGKRRTERQIVFDFERHRVQMATGGTPMTLPLAAGARDPMTALFYVRTLPLVSGASYSLPLTDNGRPSRLEVTIGGVETVDVDGKPLRAWKVTPAIRQRIERGQPLTLVTWVSADDRQIPLIVDIAAAFGRVRAELVSYRAQ